MKTRIHNGAIALAALALAALMPAMPAVAESGRTTAAAGFAIDLTPLFQAVIALLASLITAKVVPWIARRTSTEQHAGICALTRTLVFAAEQLFKTEAGSGEQKLGYVKTKLKERGFDIDIDAIEAAVMELNLGNRLASQPVDDEAAVPESDEDDVPESTAQRTSNMAE